MIHPTEQDLLMLSHRSVGLFKASSLWFHMRRCSTCRARYAELASMSSAVAMAIRPGMPSWRPIETMLRLQILVAALVVGAGVFGTQQLLTLSHNTPPAALPWTNSATSADDCKTDKIDMSTDSVGRPVRALKDVRKPSGPRNKPRPRAPSDPPLQQPGP